jgi:hypothetical protein
MTGVVMYPVGMYEIGVHFMVSYHINLPPAKSYFHY